jgi:hypothetical protein
MNESNEGGRREKKSEMKIYQQTLEELESMPTSMNECMYGFYSSMPACRNPSLPGPRAVLLLSQQVAG